MSHFTFEVSQKGVVISEARQSTGLLSRLLKSQPSMDFSVSPRSDEKLADAFAELRELGEAGGVTFEQDRITLSHDIVSRLSDAAAAILGLPERVSYGLSMEVDGLLGAPSFSLRATWVSGSRTPSVRRTGAILDTEDGQRRLPSPLKRAIEVAEHVSDGSGDLTDHWATLARFRNAIQPDASDPERQPDFNQQCLMNEFLEELKIHVCGAMSIGGGATSGDIVPVPFAHFGPESREDERTESDALLADEKLAAFQGEFSRKGRQPAYSVGAGEYVVLTTEVERLASLISRKQHAPVEEREAFIRNPEPYIREVYRQGRAASGYDDPEDVLSEPADYEEQDEAASDCLVKTVEYRDRVIGMGQFQTPDLTEYGGRPAVNTWMPERISGVVRALEEASDDELNHIRANANDLLTQLPPEGEVPFVDVGGIAVPATDTIELVDQEIARRHDAGGANSDSNTVSSDPDRSNKMVLETESNFVTLDWHPKTTPRVPRLQERAVPNVRSELMRHQRESLDWAQRAWAFGVPGIVNADEQGLGKTLQTLAFLSWLHTEMESMPVTGRLPFLIVAPTSLLRNWESEIELHMHCSRFATVTRLYGPGITSMRADNTGTDVQTGQPTLDLSWLVKACEEGRGHNHLLLTTYRTASNYHHSLHGVRFATLVFDEIQNLKNPATITSAACRSLRADFRIGLTGTPIENKVQDLWAILDQVNPGCFSTLREYTQKFGDGKRSSLEELNRRFLEPFESRPPIGIRRLKEDVVSDLRPKQRVLLPGVMSSYQAERYDDARLKLASSSRGGALKALHHIRSVSAHPGLMYDGEDGEDFMMLSARVRQVIAALDWIKEQGERALVFVEDRKLQYRLAEYLAGRFALKRVEVINGSTPVPKRQAIVQGFQMHLKTDGGFDVLVLGPRAAGTGLTLTAANHVLHVSRWWNPAVEEQCNDRVHRIGQTKGVVVHLPLAIHPQDGPFSFDCLLQRLMLRKRMLALDVLAPLGDGDGDVEVLQDELRSLNVTSVPNFDGIGAFKEWVNRRLDEYLKTFGKRQPTSGLSEVIVRLHNHERQLIPSQIDSATRIVDLIPGGQAVAKTLRTTEGVLVVTLGGELLSLWPEAVIQPGELVSVIDD